LEQRGVRLEFGTLVFRCASVAANGNHCSPIKAAQRSSQGVGHQGILTILLFDD
jgi:hypothetical protein